MAGRRSKTVMARLALWQRLSKLLPALPYKAWGHRLCATPKMLPVQQWHDARLLAWQLRLLKVKELVQVEF